MLGAEVSGSRLKGLSCSSEVRSSDEMKAVGEVAEEFRNAAREIDRSIERERENNHES